MYSQIPFTRAESASSSSSSLSDDDTLPLLSNNDRTPSLVSITLSISASLAAPSTSSSSILSTSASPSNPNYGPISSWYRSRHTSSPPNPFPHLDRSHFRSHLSNYRNEIRRTSIHVIAMQAHYHGEIDCRNARLLLHKDGDFLLRSLASVPRQIVLCALSHGRQFRQVMLGEDRTEIRCAGRRFSSIEHFVRFHFFTGQFIHCQTGEYFPILRPVASFYPRSE